MGRLISRLPCHHKALTCLILLSFFLSGCTAITAVSAIPGALYGAVADHFSSDEVSFPHSMRACLIATQQSLQAMRLDIDILEIQEEGGYAIAFNNHKLNGEIILLKQTERLTTIRIQVRSLTRQESIEQAIIKMMGTTLATQDRVALFQLASYHNLRSQPKVESKHLGWFRPGALLDVDKTNTAGWLKIKLPSGDSAFLKGDYQRKQNSFK